jgi:hypothetical protein
MKKRMPVLSRMKFKRDRSGGYMLTTVRGRWEEIWWVEPAEMRWLHDVIGRTLKKATPMVSRPATK